MTLLRVGGAMLLRAVYPSLKRIVARLRMYKRSAGASACVSLIGFGRRWPNQRNIFVISYLYRLKIICAFVTRLRECLHCIVPLRRGTEPTCSSPGPRRLEQTGADWSAPVLQSPYRDWKHWTGAPVNPNATGAEWSLPCRPMPWTSVRRCALVLPRTW